ncbi:MAG: hypothetical protein C4523_19575 [Myxococcales bacterium]|nr:MAG: hypothetical protein C4523_19575 [Myxococcales bacterium]
MMARKSILKPEPGAVRLRHVLRVLPLFLLVSACSGADLKVTDFGDQDAADAQSDGDEEASEEDEIIEAGEDETEPEEEEIVPDGDEEDAEISDEGEEEEHEACVCDAAGPCCDGCQPIAEGETCPDDDLACTSDACEIGVCQHRLASGFCLIDDACMEKDSVDPENACLHCDPATADDRWSEVADGSPCPGDALDCTADLCLEGECAHSPDAEHCVINGVCIDAGTLHPELPCYACDPDTASIAWSPVSDQPCPSDGLGCTDDRCQNGECVHEVESRFCAISGACVSAGARHPEFECLLCDPDLNRTAWSEAMGVECTEDNLACTFDLCMEGECQHIISEENCLIGGACVANGAPGPDSACQICSPQEDPLGWSPHADGTPCADDQRACTTDACQNGACTHVVVAGFCLIGNACYEDGQSSPATYCQYCDAAFSSRQWRNRQTGADCSLDQCVVSGHCDGGACLAEEYIPNDCGDYECGLSPSGCFECGECDPDTQICWLDEAGDRHLCAPDRGGDCGDASGLQNFSPWPMHAQCPTHQGRGDAVGPAHPTMKWIFETEGDVASAPAIAADGTIYVASGDGKVYALYDDGAVKWIYETGAASSVTPAIGADGAVYVGSQDATLYAFTPTGLLRWSADLGGPVGRSSPAIGGSGLVYLGAHNNVLYAVNRTNSLITWLFPSAGQIDSSPAVGEDGTIYVGSQDQKLYAIRSNGTLKWSLTTVGPLRGSPAIGADGTIYIGTQDGRLHALDAAGGARWSSDSGGEIRYASPAIGQDGTIYIGNREGALTAFNPDGTQRWRFLADHPIESAVGIDGGGNLYFGSGSDGVPGGKLYAVDPDGNMLWSYSLASASRSGGAIGADGAVYFGSDDDTVLAFQDCEANAAWCGADRRYHCNASGTGLSGAPENCPGGCHWDLCMQDHAIRLASGFGGLLTAPDSSSLRIPKPHLTIEAWIRVESGQPGQILAKGTWATSSVNYVLSVACSASDCTLALGLNHNGGVYGWQARKSGNPTPFAWTHVATVLDDTTHAARMFWNGERLTNFISVPTSWPSSITLAAHGALQLSAGLDTTFIDEVRISDVPRYENSFTPSVNLLPDGHTRLLYHMNEGSGTTVRDSSPYLNQGTLSGSASWTSDTP